MASNHSCKRSHPRVPNDIRPGSVRGCFLHWNERTDWMRRSSKPVQATRASTALLPLPESTPSFLIGKANKSYKHQYSNIYFIRLRLLRQSVEEKSYAKWKNLSGKPVLVPRVLDVVKSHLCYIVGTVYMEMPLKPNVMIDIARDVRLAFISAT